MIEAGRGFEDQMARVKAISNASTKNFEMMRKEAARLGSTTKYSARQAAAALENLVRNGLSATKATKALSSVLELAGANAIELAEAADIVTNTMNMFEISIEDLNRVNDVLSKTTASSATNLTDLYEALKYAAPTANLFGINIEEVNAALGILANQGIKGS
jgi:TP901 family phage tail tape measure protein